MESSNSNTEVEPNELLLEILKYLDACDVTFSQSYHLLSNTCHALKVLNLDNTKGQSLGKSLSLLRSYFKASVNTSTLTCYKFSGCYWIPSSTLIPFLRKCAALEELYLTGSSLTISDIGTCVLLKCPELTTLSITLRRGEWDAHLLEDFKLTQALKNLVTLELVLSQDYPTYEAVDLLKSNCLLEMSCIDYAVRNPVVEHTALITPWNLPLYLLSLKIALAIASGNTVVCKPSENTYVSAWMLCHYMNSVGLLVGVVNMVFGTASAVGEALINHKDVDVILFTGSAGVGRDIGHITAKSLKKVSLELGGKNAGIIHDYADLPKTIPSTINSWFHKGEICLCTSRLFFHQSIFDDFVHCLVTEAKKLKIGSPTDNDFMGPLISEAHLNKIRGYVIKTREGGATIHCGETVEELSLAESYKKGYFIRPTVITGLSDSSPYIQKEIFGPVVFVVPFETEKDVIERASEMPVRCCLGPRWWLQFGHSSPTKLSG